MSQPSPSIVENLSSDPSRVELMRCYPGIRDLAPMIFRQRLVIEGTLLEPMSEDKMKDYLRELSAVCGMSLLMEPTTHRSHRYGWAGWVHWEDSGAHFYAWDSPKLFFSVDVYTCKKFDVHRACEFTKTFFEAPRVVAMTF